MALSVFLCGIAVLQIALGNGKSRSVNGPTEARCGSAIFDPNATFTAAFLVTQLHRFLLATRAAILLEVISFYVNIFNSWRIYNDVQFTELKVNKLFLL